MAHAEVSILSCIRGIRFFWEEFSCKFARCSIDEMLSNQAARRNRLYCAGVDALTDWLAMFVSLPILLSFVRVPYLLAMLTVNGHLACSIRFFSRRTNFKVFKRKLQRQIDSPEHLLSIKTCIFVTFS